jgi:co-chaperonin GroES (HSP10)
MQPKPIDIEKFECLKGKALLLLDNVPAAKTSGGLMLPEEARCAMSNQQIDGILVKTGEKAFENEPNKPSIGDRVFFKRYEGIVILGADDNYYRLLSTDILNKEIILGFHATNPNE